MRIAVLGATGKVGHLIVEQAVLRQHDVVALVRDPARFESSAASDRVEVRTADVTSSESFPELSDVDVVISAIGISKGDGPGALVAGAKMLSGMSVRTLWLGALGSGTSTGAGGTIYQAMMTMFVGKELAEKAEADAIALRGGATVFHAPDLRVGALSATRRNVPLDAYRRPILPPHISRATAAALLLDEAERAGHRTQILVPLASA